MAHIKTYLRIKPSASPYNDYESTSSTVYLRIPEAYQTGSSNAAFKPKLGISNHEFHFNRVFNDTATQEEIYSVSAKSIVDGKLRDCVNRGSAFLFAD